MRTRTRIQFRQISGRNVSRGLSLAVLAWANVAAVAQGINMDLDEPFGDEGTGAGAPSSLFGGAANQPGLWNAVLNADHGPRSLLGLNGLTTTVVYSKVGGVGGGGYAFGGNTGDFRRLLNDSATVAGSQGGGFMSCIFSGFSAGAYDVYTYAVQISGRALDEAVEVPEAIANNIQIVTGPMPGNGFAYLVTHSIHRVVLSEGGGFHVNFNAPTLPDGYAYEVEGFQIVPVPEPAAVQSLGLGLAMLLLSRSRWRAR